MAEMGEQVLQEIERVASSFNPNMHQQPEGELVEPLGQLEQRQAAFKSTVASRVEPITVDVTDFGDVPNLDLFGQFDSSFDLDAYDAALGGGFLDLLLPPNSEDYWQT